MNVIQPKPVPGFALQNGLLLANLMGGMNFLAQNGLTAKAGGGRTGATALTGPLVEVATVASAADSVVLPDAIPGSWLMVRNSGANAMTVYALGSDTLNGTAGATGVSQNNATSALYFCPTDGEWYRILSA